MGQQMSQQMKLAPRMIQSMEILQMQREELDARIEQEKEENVTLEDVESDEETGEGAEEGDAGAVEEPGVDDGDRGGIDGEDAVAGTDVAQQELVVDDEDGNREGFERLDEIAPEWPDDNLFQVGRPSSNRIADAGDRHHDAMANMVARAPTLHEHLLEQWGLVEIDDDHKAFGEYLLSHLDRNGRLLSRLEEIVQIYGRPVSEAGALEVLGRIQQLDPHGVGARDVRECLML